MSEKTFHGGHRDTKRGFLKFVAGGIGTLADGWVALRARAAGAVSPVMARLSSYMSEAHIRALPEEVVEKLKHHILDTFAAMVSGSELPSGRAAIRFARAYSGEKVATVAGSMVLCGPIEAALANGTLAHSDETDDTHALAYVHLGAAVSLPPCWFMRAGLVSTTSCRELTISFWSTPPMPIRRG